MTKQNIHKKHPLLLEIKNISKSFVSKKSVLKAVDRVSFNIHSGETYSIVGESGCGKTTTARMVIRLLDADKGEIFFEGSSISALTKQELRKKRHKMQIVFQNPYGSLNPRMKISALLAEAISIRTEKPSNVRAEAKRLLQSVGLGKENLDKYPHQFSGGQRQRICIARAIATNPKLIIYDEPVSALDLLVQAQVLWLLKNLQQEYGFAYLFISHDLSVVRYMSNRIGVMYNGRIVEEGTREEIFGNPQHGYTKLLFASSPTLKNADGFAATNIRKSTETYQKVLHEVKRQSNKNITANQTHYVLSDY